MPGFASGPAAGDLHPVAAEREVPLRRFGSAILADELPEVGRVIT